MRILFRLFFIRYGFFFDALVRSPGSLNYFDKFTNELTDVNRSGANVMATYADNNAKNIFPSIQRTCAVAWLSILNCLLIAKLIKVKWALRHGNVQNIFPLDLRTNSEALCHSCSFAPPISSHVEILRNLKIAFLPFFRFRFHFQHNSFNWCWVCRVRVLSLLIAIGWLPQSTFNANDSVIICTRCFPRTAQTNYEYVQA